MTETPAATEPAHLFAESVRLLDAGAVDAAEAVLQRLLLLCPDEPGAWCNLGIVLATQKRDAEAERCYRTAIALAPDYRNARFNLAYVLLRQGRYAEGWACLEARAWYDRLAEMLPFPRWQGEPLAGRRLLIGIETGHGDMIQLLRYVPQLRALGAASIGMLCHPALQRLFAGQPGLDTALAADQPLPQAGWDYWVPPWSLPFLLHTTLQNIPCALPYVQVDEALVRQWALRLGPPTNRRRVGLMWHGHAGHENDRERSLSSLDLLAPLAEVASVDFVLLQKKEPGAAPDTLGGRADTLDLGSDIADFADLAAVVSSLDLVVAVDTAVVHLAGALGKPCWVLLPYVKTDWRWLDERSDSPWYPGVLRLYRQDAAQGAARDWSGLIAAVARDLHVWAGTGTATMPATPTT